MQLPGEHGIEAWLADWLLTVPEIVEHHASRVYPVFVPTAKQMPATTYRRTSTTREKTTGQLAAGSGRDARPPSAPVSATFEIALWAPSNLEGYRKNVLVAAGLVLKLHGLKTETAAHNIRGAWIENEFDEDESPVFDDEVVALRRVLVLSLIYSDTRRNLIGGA